MNAAQQKGSDVMFQQASFVVPGNQPSWLADVRQQALAFFNEHGFPKASDEAWKYTHLQSLANIGFVPALYDANGVTKESINPYNIPGLPCYRLVFVNGWLHAGLSDTAGLESALQYTGLSKGLGAFPQAQDVLAAAPQEALTALNTALMAEGLVLPVPDGVVVDKPIHLMFLTVPGAKPYAIHPRIIIRMGKNSQAKVFETYAALGSGVYWNNSVSQVHLSQDAQLTHYQWQEESAEGYHTATALVTLEKNSRYHNFTLSMGGKIARNAIHTTLAGERAECHLDGGFLAAGSQLLDNYLPVRHDAPYCKSQQHYKGVLSGNAQGVFYGKIIVPPGAVKTDSRQLNQNLVLSQGATVYSRPELEIDTDDVQCSHGSATGDLDADAVFYLRSRGIPKEEARHLLIAGFIDDVLENIPQDAARQYTHAKVQAWLERYEGR